MKKLNNYDKYIEDIGFDYSIDYYLLILFYDNVTEKSLDAVKFINLIDTNTADFRVVGVSIKEEYITVIMESNKLRLAIPNFMTNLMAKEIDSYYFKFSLLKCEDNEFFRRLDIHGATRFKYKSVTNKVINNNWYFNNGPKLTKDSDINYRPNDLRYYGELDYKRVVDTILEDLY